VLQRELRESTAPYLTVESSRDQDQKMKQLDDSRAYFYSTLFRLLGWQEVKLASLGKHLVYCIKAAKTMQQL